jgi:hypothetical protein
MGFRFTIAADNFVVKKTCVVTMNWAKLMACEGGIVNVSSGRRLVILILNIVAASESAPIANLK